jgi:hypothetical protein
MYDKNIREHQGSYYFYRTIGVTECSLSTLDQTSAYRLSPFQ